MSALGLLVACATSPTAGPVPDLEVAATASEVTASGGVLTVRTVYRGEGELALPSPEVEGLTFSPEGEPVVEQLGDHRVVSQVWRFTGRKGSYEIGALTARLGERSASSSPVWVDLGVEPPNLEQLEDISEPAPMRTIDWRPVLCVGLGGVLLVGMVGAAFLGVARPRKRAEAALPADVRCLRAWEQIRADIVLSDEQKATELSRVFREYTEEVLGFPAVSWTTTEILAHLEAMQHLPPGNLPRARKLLRATDLVKYAEVPPGQDFFDEMDSDLRAFVASTRPAVWSTEPPPADGGTDG